MTEVIKTNKYDIFKKHESNRKIDEVNLKRIINSIKVNNLLEFRPILVDVEMRIIDGQHRLEAAKSLNIDVYYQIDREATHEHIVTLNQAQKRWEINDYLNYYASLGNSEYIKLKKYCDTRNITPNEVLSYLDSGKTMRLVRLKEGKFTFPSNDEMHRLNELLNQYEEVRSFLKKHLVSFKSTANSRLLKSAVIKFLRYPSAVFDVLMTKLTFKSDIICPKSDISGYYSMLKDIYNWKNKDPIE